MNWVFLIVGENLRVGKKKGRRGGRNGGFGLFDRLRDKVFIFEFFKNFSQWWFFLQTEN